MQPHTPRISRLRLLQERSLLRKERDFGAADAILADLSGLNVIVDDDQRSWCLRSWQRPRGNRRMRRAKAEGECGGRAECSGERQPFEVPCTDCIAFRGGREGSRKKKNNNNNKGLGSGALTPGGRWSP